MLAKLTNLPLRVRLALGGAIMVLLAMLASIIALNVFQGRQLRQEAEASLDEAIGWEEGDSPLASRVVDFIRLDDDFQPMEDPHLDSWWNGYTDSEVELAQWCASHTDTDVVGLARLNSMSCYVELIRASWDNEPEALYAAYVDVTAQLQLIHRVNVVLAAITIVGCAATAIAGWHMGKRIEQADEARTRFYENMSHELKTPLASIRGFAEGIEAGVMEPRAASGSIIRESERMTSLVEQILDLSRLEAGAVQAHREDVVVADLVQDCLMPFEGMVSMRGLSIDLDLEDEVIVADPDLLGHALENVLSNAIRHAASIVRVRADGHLIEVANDGDLPDADALAHLFDRFFTGSSTGTGIGLAYAREIVELHGWSIDAGVAGGMVQVRIRMK